MCAEFALRDMQPTFVAKIGKYATWSRGVGMPTNRANTG